MLLRTLAALCLVAVAGLPAQDSVQPAPKQLRIHVIGASVSGGLRDGPMTRAKERGDSVTLQHVLKKWAGEHARATPHNTVDMLAMFTDPPKFGKEQLQGVAKARPDIVVAVHFPFWFAYGYVQGEEAEARKAKLAEGLAMLEDLRMPVLLGTLPDMRGAAERMLSPRQIPAPAVLEQLNAQLAEFVQKHPNLHLVPLGELVRR
jgi:hypothetical protein